MGKINLYICDCGHRTITIDKDKGTTPFHVLCREEGCTAQAISQFYNVDQNLIPQWEWYRPTDQDVKKEMRELLDSGKVSKRDYDMAWKNYREHIRRGGLLLRKIKK